MPNTSKLVKKTDYNTNYRYEIKNKMFDVTNLSTKTYLHTKATEIENKTSDSIGFITTPGFNR